MNQKAQAGLEYLMTYGWALILVAAVIGALVFIATPPTATATFKSTEPTKFLVKGSSVSGNAFGLALQNISGGKMEINSIIFSGDVGDSLAGYTLNGETIDPASDFPIEIIGGGTIQLENLAAQGNGENSSLFIEYTDFAGLDGQVEIKSVSGSPPGLVAAYWFNEGTGTETADTSGNKNTGTLVNGPTWQTTDCPSENCLNYDGINDYVAVVDDDSQDITDEITLAGWAKSAAFVPTSYSVLSKSMAYHLYTRASWYDAPYFFLYFEGTEKSLSGDQIPTDEWQYLAATYKESDRTMRIFQNGVETKTRVLTGLTDYHMDISGNPLRIGRSGFNGTIDEAKIYNRALSAAEIAAEYAQGR